jgi:[acyl-carrier-protein] S-malonyltransferase
MSKLLAMFPGQGSQYVGMGKTLVENFPYTKEVFEQAEDAVNINLRKLCFEGPEDDLKLTANTQPTILTCSVATWRVLKEETGLSADIFAGHSLGEYSALVASEKLSLEDAVKLVRVRGEQMQIAVPAGKGAMSAVLNFDKDELEGICKEVSSELISSGQDEMASSVEIANYNSAKQLIISGGAEAVSKVGEILQEKKVRVVPLPVSAPFHSKLMKPAREAMTPLLNDTVINSNSNLVIPNITATLSSDYSADNLINQIDGPVLWMQSMASAIENEASKFIEVGPGSVLFGLARRAVPKGSLILHSDDIVSTIEKLNS